jgi:hypothetical protein
MKMSFKISNFYEGQLNYQDCLTLVVDTLRVTKNEILKLDLPAKGHY